MSSREDDGVVVVRKSVYGVGLYSVTGSCFNTVNNGPKEGGNILRLARRMTSSRGGGRVVVVAVASRLSWCWFVCCCFFGLAALEVYVVKRAVAVAVLVGRVVGAGGGAVEALSIWEVMV